MPVVAVSSAGRVASMEGGGVMADPISTPITITRDRDGVRFAINFAPEMRSAPAPEGVQFLLGGRDLAPGAVAAWEIASCKVSANRARSSRQ